MADQAQLEKALVNADAAGDVEAARTLAAEIKRMRSQPAPATTAEKIAGSAPVRFAYGAAEPIIGAVQMIANTSPVLGKEVNDHIRQYEGMIQAGRSENTPQTLSGLVTGQQPDPGFDWARFAGNVASPVNAGLAKVMPAATSTLGRVGTGAGAGLVGGVTMPVTDGEDFWQEKGKQGVVGALTGGILSPIAGKVVDAVAPKISQIITQLKPSQFTGPRASLQADSVLADALQEVGVTIDQIGKGEYAKLRQEVVGALKNGKQLDAAAMLRKRDFELAGVEPTLGQITRDSTQFARERNLRGMPGVGEPLQTRFDQQNQKVQQLVSALRGNPSDEYQAGKQISDVLAGADKAYRKGPEKAAWEAVRDNVGRAAPLNAADFSKNANFALDNEMLGHVLPAEARNILNDITAGKIPLNVDTMVKIDQRLSGLQRDVGQRTQPALAIGKLRDALNATPIENTLGEDAKAAYKAASGVSKTRFDMYKAIPALEAAATGEAPDKFVRNYIVGGKVDEVKALAEFLRKTDMDAFNQARSQIGDKISRAAFGENVTGDKLAAPERLAKALREIGSDKLEAFYTKGEIEQMKRLSRVVSYINQTPSSAPVNTSNNIGAMLSILNRIPGVPSGVALAGALKNVVTNHATVNAGMAANVPAKTADLSPEAKKRLAQILMLSAGGAGMAAQ